MSQISGLSIVVGGKLLGWCFKKCCENTSKEEIKNRAYEEYKRNLCVLKEHEQKILKEYQKERKEQKEERKEPQKRIKYEFIEDSDEEE